MTSRNRIIGVLATTAAVAAATGVLAGSVLGRSPAHPLAATARASQIKVADYSSGSAYAAFVARTSDRQACLLDGLAGGADIGGGCNPIINPLAGREELALFSFEGGPALGTVTGARVFGLVTARVVRLAVLMSDGSLRNLALTDTRVDRVLPANYRVFAAAFDPAELRTGLTPREIVAYGRAGKELERQDIGSDLHG